MEVTKNGKINGACDRKNECDNTFQGLIPSCFNIAIVKVGDQNSIDVSDDALPSSLINSNVSLR